MTTIDLHGLHNELLLVNGKKSRKILCTVKRGKVKYKMQQERSVYFFFASRNSILNWKHGSRSRQCLSSLWKEAKGKKGEEGYDLCLQ